MATELVRASDLTRTFDGRAAVEALSLAVNGGEVVALLGPNGAGKTTTLRMMAGLLLPTAGSIVVAGETLSRQTADHVRRRVGLLTETPGLWERLTVRLNLLTYARLHGVSDPEGRVAHLLAAVNLRDRADDRAGTLSKGLKQRVAIARALVHDPPVVLLDEPTAGLDPESARDVRDLVHRLRGDGRAVLVSTHNLGEAEELADRIAVMNTRLLAFDAPRALGERRRAGQVLVEIEGGAGRWAAVAGQMGQTVLDATGDRLLVQIGGGAAVPDLVSALVTAGARVRRVAPQEPSLEDAYLELVRRDG
jgi:ABC-2 type transport system ATP-binding protein